MREFIGQFCATCGRVFPVFSFLVAGAASVFGQINDRYMFEQEFYADDSRQIARALALCSDGGYAIVGENDYYLDDVNKQVFGFSIVRLNLDGTVNWTKTYGVKGQSNNADCERGTGIIVVEENGAEFLLALASCQYSGNIVVVKVGSSDGALQWGRTILSPSSGVLESTQIRAAGNRYIIEGNLSSPGSSEIFLAALEPTIGTVQWARTYRSAVQIKDVANGLRVMNGRIFVAGWIIESQHQDHLNRSVNHIDPIYAEFNINSGGFVGASRLKIQDQAVAVNGRAYDLDFKNDPYLVGKLNARTYAEENAGGFLLNYNSQLSQWQAYKILGTGVDPDRQNVVARSIKAHANGVIVAGISNYLTTPEAAFLLNYGLPGPSLSQTYAMAGNSQRSSSGFLDVAPLHSSIAQYAWDQGFIAVGRIQASSGSDHNHYVVKTDRKLYTAVNCEQTAGVSLFSLNVDDEAIIFNVSLELENLRYAGEQEFVERNVFCEEHIPFDCCIAGLCCKRGAVRESQIDQKSRNVALAVYPNPASRAQTLTIQISSPWRTKMQFTISDLLGRNLFETTRLVGEGTSEIEIADSGFAPGTYLLRVSSVKGEVLHHILIGE